MGLQESGGSERRIRAKDQSQGSEPRIRAKDQSGGSMRSILIGIVTLLQMPQDAHDENIFIT